MQRRRQPGLGVWLLLYQLFAVIGIERIPPVTLCAIGLQAAAFLRLIPLPWRGPRDACVSAHAVWHRGEHRRLLFAAFEHGDDWHLYYNMVSFALKGISLERRMGSGRFLWLLAAFTVATNAVLVALTEAFRDYLGDQCAVGFSGVIFALKVLTTHHDSGWTRSVMGIPLNFPSRYAVWLELVLIQLMVPHASFLGHLAGILVGSAYVMGPMRRIMDFLYSLVTTVLAAPSRAEPRFTPRAEPTGYRPSEQAPPYSSYVPPGMDEEEQLRRAMEESLRDGPQGGGAPYPQDSGSRPPEPGFVYGQEPRASAPPPPGFAPDIDELRNRRQAHFAGL